MVLLLYIGKVVQTGNLSNVLCRIVQALRSLEYYVLEMPQPSTQQFYACLDCSKVN